MPSLGARLVVAGTHSGVGKTTVATGIMAALRAKGMKVASAKVGPDFIDPGYHQLATGRSPCSLDVFLHGGELLPSLAAAASSASDILVVEGVMGLFDGSGLSGEDGSTAEVSRIIGAPVVLVIDASAMSRSAAAIVHGFATFDPRLDLAGVILNRVASEGHALLLSEAIAPLGIPVLGMIPTRDEFSWRDRHLGLVPVVEQPEAVQASLERLQEMIAGFVDLEALVAIANRAPLMTTPAPPTARRIASARIAVCSGPAFSFVYPENLVMLTQAGAELIPFDPLSEPALPDRCSGLYLGGGFPEVFVAQLAENRRLLDEIRTRVGAGLVTWAECGGLLLLCESLQETPMAGALEGVHARMGDRLTLGYRTATTLHEGIFGPAGTELRGHEFHYSFTDPAGEALELKGRFGEARGGFATPTLLASYLHQHLAATPHFAEHFVRRAAQETEPT